ncbi:MAG TPA: hypothetical protein VIV12_05140 [Streptosporangiaceae bacterium]
MTTAADGLRTAAAKIRALAKAIIDRAGAWLCGHRCSWLALWMWRACRMI